MVKYSAHWLDLTDYNGARYGDYIVHDGTSTVQVTCRFCDGQIIKYASRGFNALSDHSKSLKHRSRSSEILGTPFVDKAIPRSKKPGAACLPNPELTEVVAEFILPEAGPSRTKKDHGIQILSNELIKQAEGHTSPGIEKELVDYIDDVDKAIEFLRRCNNITVIPPQLEPNGTIVNRGSAPRPVTPVVFPSANLTIRPSNAGSHLNGAGTTWDYLRSCGSPSAVPAQPEPRPVTPVVFPSANLTPTTITPRTIAHYGSVTPVTPRNSNVIITPRSILYGQTPERQNITYFSPSNAGSHRNGAGTSSENLISCGGLNAVPPLPNKTIVHHGSASRPVKTNVKIMPRPMLYDKTPEKENVYPGSSFGQFLHPNAASGHVKGRSRFSYQPSPSQIDYPYRSEYSGFDVFNDFRDGSTNEFTTSTPAAKGRVMEFNSSSCTNLENTHQSKLSQPWCTSSTQLMTSPMSISHQSPRTSSTNIDYNLEFSPRQTPGAAGTEISSDVGAGPSATGNKIISGPQSLPPARLPMVSPLAIPHPNPVPKSLPPARLPMVSPPAIPHPNPVPQNSGKRTSPNEPEVSSPKISKQSCATAGPSGSIDKSGTGFVAAGSSMVRHLAGSNSASSAPGTSKSGVLPTKSARQPSKTPTQTPSVTISFEISLKLFKGKRNAEPQETIDIQTNDQHQLINELWTTARKYIEREAVFRPGVGDEPPQVASWSKTRPIIEQIDNYIDINDGKSKMYSAGVFLLDPGKMQRLNGQKVTAYVYKYSKNVKSKDWLNYLQSQLMVTVNKKDRAGAASNQRVQEIADKLIQIHSKKFDAQWIAYYLWASAIEKTAPTHPEELERFLQRGPPQDMIQNFDVRGANRNPVLEERYVLAKNTNDSYANLLKQSELDIAIVDQVVTDGYTAWERFKLRFGLILRNHASRADIINSTVTRPVETARSQHFASLVTNCPDIDHAE